MIFRSMIPDRSFLFRQIEKRNCSTFVCVSLSEIARTSHPRVSKIARLRGERGIISSTSSTSRRPLPSTRRLAERTLSRKLLNRRRFPRSTSSSSSSSSSFSSSLSRMERRERESRMGCCVMGLTNDRTREATRCVCHGRTFT